MAFSAITARGSATEKTSDTSLSMSPSANLTVNKLVIVHCATDNNSDNVADEPSESHSLSDSQGNIWRKVTEYTDSDGAAADGVTSSLWYTIVTTQIGTGNTITLTTASAVTNKIISCFEVTRSDTSKSIGVAQVGVTHGITATIGTLASREYLLVGAGASEGNDDAKTPDADYTERFDLRTGSGTASTEICTHVVTRIATLTDDTCTSSAWTNTNPVFFLAALYEFSPTPKISTISDNFDDNSLDGAKWGKWENAGATLTETNQHIEIATSTSIYESAGLYAIDNLDLYESSLTVKLVQKGTDVTARVPQIGVDDSNCLYVYIDQYGSFGANYITQDNYMGLFWIETWDASAHKFLRVREASGVLYIEYSADRTNWTVAWSGRIPVCLSDVSLSFSAFPEVDATPTTTVIIDGVNISPTTSSLTKSLKYCVKKTPSAITKSLKYTVKVTPSAITKSLQYVVVSGGTSTHSITKSLKFCVKTIPTASTKSLKYTVKTTHSAITKSLVYDVKKASSLTKSLKYTVKTTHSAITKSLVYHVKMTSPSVGSAFAVNYKSITNADADITYFRSIGVDTVRIHIPFPDDATDFPAFLELARKFYFAGFYVIYGCTAEINAGYTWATYRTNCLIAAAAAEGRCSEFNIGNEMDLGNDDAYISDATIRSNIRSLATEVQAVFSGVVSYVTSSGLLSDTWGSQHWEAEGKGDLDKIGINIYGWADTPFTNVDHDGYGWFVPSFFKTFGSAAYVAEFNLDGDYDLWNGIPEDDKTAEMRKMYAYIKNWSIPSAHYFQYRGYRDEDDMWAAKKIDGTVLGLWSVFFAGDLNRPTYLLNFAGNAANTVITPYDPAIMQIGASSDYSIGAKVYLKPKSGGSEGGDNHGIANCDSDYGANKGYLFQVDATTGALVVYAGSTSYSSSAGVVPYNQWAHIAFTITGTTLKGYVNGSLVWTQTGFTRVATGSTGDKIFGAESLGFRELYGYAKDFWAVKSLLTLTDVGNITTGSYPTLGVHYLVDEGISYAARDTSGNTNHGDYHEPDWVPPPVVLTKSLKYCVKTVHTAITKTLTYRVKFQTVSQTKSLKYTVRKTQSALTKSLKYTVKVVPSGLTKSLKYTVTTTHAAITKSQKYTVKTTPSAKTKSLQYMVRPSASLTKSLQYCIKLSPKASLTKSLQYEIAHPVSVTKSLKYTVRITPSAITKSLQYVINATSTHSVTKSLKYTIVTPHSAITKTLIYRVRTTAPITKSLKYTVKAPLSLTKSLKYTVKTTPTAITKSLRYAVRFQTVNITKQLKYEVRKAQSITKSLKYCVKTSPALTKSLKYTVKTSASLTKSLKYAIRLSKSPIQKTLQYNVLYTPTALQKSLKYTILKQASLTKSLSYRVKPTITITKSLKYSIYHQNVAITKTLEYRIGIVTTITKPLVYVIHSTQGITKSLKYCIAKRSIITKSLRYDVLHSPYTRENLYISDEACFSSSGSYTCDGAGYSLRDDYFPL